MSTDLFAPFRLGPLELANRIVMAPMTRNRTPDTVPNDLNVEYYAQRAGAGLIITEGVQPSAVGQGYPGTPGLHTDAQTDGWRRVADAVHARGGTIIAQIMHAGRISHPDLIGTTPVSSSATRPAGQVFTGSGMQDFHTPRALELDELPGIVEEYVDAARRAVAAGLDGVELHAANGYLLHQFLADGINVRTDAYGGSGEARARFVLEVARAVAAEVGPQRVGIRISPGGSFNDVAEVEVEATYTALVEGLAPLGLLYLHVIADADTDYVEGLRKQFAGPTIINTGIEGPSDLATGQQIVDEGNGDLFAIGRAFIANPDLVERLRTGAPLAAGDEGSYYGGDAGGYTDYPTLTAA